jgi:hypothetical protein
MKLQSNDIRLTPNMRWLSFDRTIPTTVGNAVDLGTYTVTNGGSNMELWMTVASTGYAQAKRYIFPTKYNGSLTWTKVEAISSTGAYNDGGGNQDTDLEVNITGTAVALRLRRKSGTTAGTAKLSLAYQGYASADTWTPSTTSAAVTAPTARYAVYADALLSDVLVAGTNLAVAPGSFSTFNWNSTGYPVRVVSWASTHNGGSTPAAPSVVHVFARQGVGGAAYDNYAEVKIGRYENASVSARTKIVWALTHGNGDAAGTDVFGLYSSGRMQLPVSAPPASATAAGNAGDVTWDASYIYICTATNTWKRVAIATW